MVNKCALASFAGTYEAIHKYCYPPHIRRCVSCVTPNTQGNGYYFVYCAAAAGFVVVCVLIFALVSQCCFKGRKGDEEKGKGEGKDEEGGEEVAV